MTLLDELRRLHAHLPEQDDLTLIILKGHLLLEERIERIIRIIVAHGDLLNEVRLTFIQKAMLARSMCWSQHTNKLWDLIFALNSLRNDLAHQLEPPTFDAKLNHFLAAHRAEYDDHEKFREVVKGASAPEQLRYAIAQLLGFLDSYEQDARAYRKAVDKFYAELSRKD